MLILVKITMRYKGASKKVRFAYKVFDLVNGRYRQEYQAIGKIWNTLVGKWIKAESVSLITNNSLFERVSFGASDAFLTRKAADKWRAGDNAKPLSVSKFAAFVH